MELTLKFEHHQIMVDGVKGSGQVKQADRGHVLVVSSKQVVVDLQDSFQDYVSLEDAQLLLRTW